MFIALVVGLIAGFLISIPVGPINVAVVNTFIKHNFKLAFAIAVGGGLMDFVYFIVFLNGLSLFQLPDQITLILKIVGVLFIFGFGLKEVFIKKANFNLSEKDNKKTPTVIGFFLLGVIIYASNPTLLATMSGLAAFFRSWNLIANDFYHYLAVSIGLGIGSALWSYVLIVVMRKYQKRLPEQFFINFSRTCGVLIILISFYMAFTIYQENFI
jgi:threonine/homoserine/homoserine lactone efflux protein